MQVRKVLYRVAPFATVLFGCSLPPVQETPPTTPEVSEPAPSNYRAFVDFTGIGVVNKSLRPGTKIICSLPHADKKFAIVEDKPDKNGARNVTYAYADNLFRIVGQYVVQKDGSREIGVRYVAYRSTPFSEMVDGNNEAQPATNDKRTYFYNVSLGMLGVCEGKRPAHADKNKSKKISTGPETPVSLPVPAKGYVMATP